MAKFHITAGAEIETITPNEMHDYMSGRRQAEQDRLRGIKFRRLPRMYATVNTGNSPVIQIAGDYPVAPAGVFGNGVVGGNISPTAGHFWFLRLISVNGLTAGNPADLLNMQILGASEPDFNWWQFNGNNFSYAWGKNELWLEAGEYLQFNSTGAIAAANGARIRVQGMIQQVPAQLAAEMI